MLNSTTALELSVDAYCTLSHIQAKIPLRTLSDSTLPTRRQALTITRGIYKQINAALDVLGYVIPVASTNATNIGYIQEMNAMGAAAQIEGAAYSSGNESRSQYAEDLGNQFKLMWKTLTDGKVSLPTAARQGDYIHRENEKDGAYQFNPIDGVEQDAVFSKQMDF